MKPRQTTAQTSRHISPRFSPLRLPIGLIGVSYEYALLIIEQQYQHIRTPNTTNKGTGSFYVYILLSNKQQNPHNHTLTYLHNHHTSTL